MILVLGVWTFLRTLLGSSAAVTRPAPSTGGPAAISRSTSAPAPGPDLLDLALTPLSADFITAISAPPEWRRIQRLPATPVKR
jgi:hypothetical protein